MKKSICLLILALLSSSFAIGQTKCKMVVETNSGSKYDYKTDKIKNIKFKAYDDVSGDISMLEGTWTGDIYQYGPYDLLGENYRMALYFNYTDMGAGWGYGYKLIYNSNNPYNESSFQKFTWKVKDGDILIYIGYYDGDDDGDYDDEYYGIIYDYTINENQFSGYYLEYSTNSIHFELTRDNDFDWSYWAYVPTMSLSERKNIQPNNNFVETLNNNIQSTANYKMVIETNSGTKYDYKTNEIKNITFEVEHVPVEISLLEGTWTGQIDTYINSRYGLSGDHYRTAMYFEYERNYRGRGRELDYDSKNMYGDYFYCEFTWEFNDGKIRIHYDDYWNDFYIYDYTLSENHFSGYIDDGTSHDIHFEFTRDNNFDWERKDNPNYPPQETEENVNKNTNGPMEAQTRLEFPHLKNGIVLVHNAELNKNTHQTGVNYCVEWDTELSSQRWSCYQLYNSINYNSSYNVSRYYAPNDGSLSPTCQYPNDPVLPVEYQFSVDPYKFSGYDHGHLCPSGDRLRSTDCNYQTFFITNMQPQYNKFNAGLWQEMESDVRNWVSMSDTLYVCKGGTIDNEEYILEYIHQNSHQATRVNKDHIPVPRFFYMALLSKKGDTWRGMAYWVPNLDEDHSNDSRKGYALKIDRLEELTGIDFFCNLPDDIEEKVESELTLSHWFK